VVDAGERQTMAVDEDQRAVARARTQAVNRWRVAAGAVETLEAARATATLAYCTGARAAEACYRGDTAQHLCKCLRAARFDLGASDGDQVRAHRCGDAETRARDHDFFQRGLVRRRRLLLAGADAGKSCKDAQQGARTDDLVIAHSCPLTARACVRQLEPPQCCLDPVLTI